MRKIREILRLKYEAGLSERQIAQSAGVARSTVQECLRRARQAGVGWPLPEGWDEARCEEALYPPATAPKSVPLPEFAQVEQALRRKGVTLLLLWQEYKAAHPEGLQYSSFCERFARWRASRDVVLRQVHVPGEKLFLDYAGQTAEVIDRSSGEVRRAQVFVAVLGASSYTYAEATWTQSLADWLGSQRRALEFFGGVPALLVPDNLRSAVSRAHRYEPDINPAYQDFAEHYGTVVLPARVRKPRDKAKVEVGVQVVERWILARLRHRQFFSLGELNAAIAELLAELNARPFRKREGCRASLFAQLDQPALKPLPLHPYDYGEWKKARVHLDYHVEVGRHYYSVPHALIGQRVDVRVSASVVEIYRRGQRIAVHARSQQRGGYSTHPEHRPPRHAAVVDLNHERLQRQAQAIGPGTVGVLQAQLQRRLHPEQALRSALGILRLAQDFSPQALETACGLALRINSVSYRSVRSLIEHPPATPEVQPAPVHTHENLRGAHYFAEGASC
jgi:transposase